MNATSQRDQAQSLLTCIESVDSPAGRRRVVEYLETRPFPHFEPAPDAPGLLVRIEADGKRTLGRFVNRKFRTVKKPRRSKSVKAVEKKPPRP